MFFQNYRFQLIECTNYDHLIEDTLEQKANYKVECKRNEESLTINRQDSDVLVYKIHGDIDEPNKAIITKDDYELFEKTHKLLQQHYKLI